MDTISSINSSPVEYKGYEIATRAFRPLGDTSWHATYFVRSPGDGRPGVAGTIASAFASSDEAVAAAIGAAKHWIDKQA